MSDNIQDKKVVNNDGFYNPSIIENKTFLFVIQEYGTGRKKFEEELEWKMKCNS